MQVLKEQVRQAILAHAVDEFYENGYLGTSMRTIANKVGITAGNIYRYYENKEDLFKAIVNPVRESILKLTDIDAMLAKNKIESKDEAKAIVEGILSLMRNFTKELFILIFNSEGSRYAFMKDDLVRIVETKMKKMFDLSSKGEFVRIVASGFIQAVFVVLKDNAGDAEAISDLLTELIVFYFRDLESRI